MWLTEMHRLKAEMQTRQIARLTLKRWRENKKKELKTATFGFTI
jgi:hypothetical protein